MFMKVYRWVIIILIGIVGWGCSTGSDNKIAYISGTFSVADSIDNTGDFSGIGLTIIKRDSANAAADTLFHTFTDTAGTFSGIVSFTQEGQYPLIISRNKRNLSRTGIILSDEDSIKIEGQLPNLSQTMTIESPEHQAMDRYRQVKSSFQRVLQVAGTGQLTGDSLRQELQKWSDIYWSVYQQEIGTMASELSARESINILDGLDRQKMMTRIRAVQDNDQLSDLGATFGKRYVAENQGLEPALAYLDSLADMTETKQKAMRINMEQIKLLYDSARIDAAKKRLKSFKEKYPDQEAFSDWVTSISYDLNYLSPGDAIPDFKFGQNGKTISRDSLLGTPYILEITRLSNRLYQNQFDRTVVIHSIYKNFGLEVVTIPLDESQVTIDGFFEERVRPWPVAAADDFNQERLLRDFNIQLIPTRFLVDREGNIVRKYVGQEYGDVIKGIQTIIQTDQEPPS